MSKCKHVGNGAVMSEFPSTVAVVEMLRRKEGSMAVWLKSWLMHGFFPSRRLLV